LADRRYLAGVFIAAERSSVQNGESPRVIHQLFTSIMPIKVQCACGKAFAAKDELAGKTVKCPSCQKPLKITEGAAPAKAAAKPSSSGAAKAAAPPPAGGMSDLFDEIGLKAAEKGTMPCPGCGVSLPQEAVVCVKCGYNMKLGRKMSTIKTGSEAGGHIGHGAVAADLMEKAAAVLEGDEEAEATKTTEGMPWWVYLVVLLILIGIAAYMLNRSGGGEESKDGKKARLDYHNSTTAFA